jgi:hypothetical protein
VDFLRLADEFKPASIDTGSPGTLHKGVENKVTVEFSNNQAGKPKVAFQGNSEDCKDMDAVIFFDGQNFRLERLHRAVKSLRHLRQGETAAALAGSGSGALSPIHANGAHSNAEKSAYKAHHVQPLLCHVDAVMSVFRDLPFDLILIVTSGCANSAQALNRCLRRIAAYNVTKKSVKTKLMRASYE